jgi:protein SCO1/2
MKKLACLIVLTALSSAQPFESSAESGTNAQRSCCAPSLGHDCFTEKSVYQTESVWTTDQGRQLTLGELAGRPQVVVMFFANCQFACPILVLDLKRIEAALPKDISSQVGFTLVSFDPERDTPEALAQFRRMQQLPELNWTLLHGKADDVLELSALLGLKFKREANGQFAHSNVITVLNAEGEIVHQQIGLNQEITETARVIRQLSAQTKKPVPVVSIEASAAEKSIE